MGRGAETFFFPQLSGILLNDQPISDGVASCTRAAPPLVTQLPPCLPFWQWHPLDATRLSPTTSGSWTLPVALCTIAPPPLLVVPTASLSRYKAPFNVVTSYCHRWSLPQSFLAAAVCERSLVSAVIRISCCCGCLAAWSQTITRDTAAPAGCQGSAVAGSHAPLPDPRQRPSLQ